MGTRCAVELWATDKASGQAAIEAVLAEPGTIGVGYNTIRFDDEVTRHLFWRNLEPTGSSMAPVSVACGLRDGQRGQGKSEYGRDALG